MTDTEDQKKKPNYATVIGSVIGVMVATVGVPQLFKKSVEEQLIFAAKEVNKICPKQIDEYMRLDSATAVGKKMFQYHYTLFNYEKSEMNFDTINKYLRPGVIDNVKNNADLKDFRKHKITMDYNYYDKHGEHSYNISVTPDMYTQE